MNIAIVGAGKVGTALATGWLKSGHKVTFAVRDPHADKMLEVVNIHPGSSALTISEAFEASEIIVIATPAQAVSGLTAHLQLHTHKVIIDSTNAIGGNVNGFPTAFHAIKDACGAPHLVKCFNSTGFENMRNPVYNGSGIDMFAAGDSALAKKAATRLALDLGFAQCHDFGGDDKVELLEKLALCWINLAIIQGQGRNIALRVEKR